MFAHGEVLLSRTSEGGRWSQGSRALTGYRLWASCANTEIDVRLSEDLGEPGHSRQE